MQIYGAKTFREQFIPMAGMCFFIILFHNLSTTDEVLLKCWPKGVNKWVHLTPVIKGKNLRRFLSTATKTLRHKDNVPITNITGVKQ